MNTRFEFYRNIIIKQRENEMSTLISTTHPHYHLPTFLKILSTPNVII
jgi:hypothetical protein